MQDRTTEPRQRGGMAVTIAAVLPLLIVSSGAAIDYMRYADAKARLQTVVDQAALAAAKNPGASMDDMTKWSKMAASINLPKGFVLDPVRAPVADSTAIHFTLSGKLNTMMMRFLGLRTMTVSVNAKAQRAQSGPLELVLALDYTWSMNDPPPGGGDRKIDTLKAVAKDLVTSVMSNNSAVVGLVPFTDWINVGTSYNGQAWLDVPATEITWGPTYLGSTFGPDMCPADGGLAPCRHDRYDNSRRVQVVRPFKGCVGLRPPPYQEDINASPDVKYKGSLIDCSIVLPIVELTRNNDGGAGKGTLKITKAIDRLDAFNHEYRVETFIPMGLTWGWNMLTAERPLDKALTRDQATSLGARKVLLLMTDGSNSVTTFSDGLAPTRRIPRQPDAVITAANNLTATLCQNIKNPDKDGITIYTIGFGISDDTTLDMLKKCASPPVGGLQYYFDARSNEALKQAFSQIGAQLAQPRLLQ